MTEQEANRAEAIRMLQAFGSVGVGRFDVTLTDQSGHKVQFRRGVALAVLQRDLAALLTRSEGQGENVIVRPVAAPPTLLVQLDDLDAAGIARVHTVAFLTLQTSEGNFQAWIALNENPGSDIIRRIRKGAGADPTASGATRIVGSRNFKPRYAPDFPIVAIASVRPGHVVSLDQLHELGLVAAPAVTSSTSPTPPHNAAPRVSPSGFRSASASAPLSAPRPRAWPDYARCLAHAPANHAQTGPDVSRADFTFALLALDWGHSLEDTMARLAEQSAKAQENGERYVRLTVERAGAVLRARSETPPPRPQSAPPAKRKAPEFDR